MIENLSLLTSLRFQEKVSIVIVTIFILFVLLFLLLFFSFLLSMFAVCTVHQASQLQLPNYVRLLLYVLEFEIKVFTHIVLTGTSTLDLDSLSHETKIEHINRISK